MKLLLSTEHGQQKVNPKMKNFGDQNVFNHSKKLVK